jgi:membrane protein implicated in regulation of membrane protease activity
MSVDDTTKGDVMNDTTPGELFDEASNWAVGGGIVTLALFPLALPGIILAVAAAIPLLAVVLGLALVVGAVAVPVLLARALVRRVRALRVRRPQAGETGDQTDQQARSAVTGPHLA